MKIFFVIVCFLISVLNGSFVYAEEPLHKTNPVLFLTLQNYRVLSGRIYKMLEYRLSSFNECSVATQTSFRERFKRLPKYSDQKQTVLDVLDLYKDSYDTDVKCKKGLDRNEYAFKTLEREKFSQFHRVLNLVCSNSLELGNGSMDRSCLLKMHQVFSELDPHCVSLQVPNITNEYDPFPCMMADYLIGRSMVNEKTWTYYVSDTQNFLDRLRKYFSDPVQRTQGIDLWSVFRDTKSDTPELREEFLAQINFIFSSSQSGSSYIRGFHDHIWQFVLKKTQSAETTLDYFVKTRISVNEFRAIFNWATKHKFLTNIRGLPTEGKNRHDYMAAFLSCHYRQQNRLFHESLPVLLGYGYETLDFKSHILVDKDSFKVAKDNFVTDTNRYRTGVYWGYRFCTQQF